MNETPDFIDLDALARQVAENPVLVVAERLSGILQQLDDGVLAGTRHAGNSAERNALSHHSEDFGALGGGELVHTDPYA
jgi:hypothetical protein